MGAPEPATMRALTLVVVYEIAKNRFASVMHDRPALVEERSELVAKRLETEEHLRHESDSGAASRPVSRAARIRHLFAVPPHSLKRESRSDRQPRHSFHLCEFS